MSATTTYQVEGMTCGHCVKAVTDEISALPGVSSVDVQLVEGGVSPVAVTSEEPLSHEQVYGAVDEAGYVLVG